MILAGFLLVYHESWEGGRGKVVRWNVRMLWLEREIKWMCAQHMRLKFCSHVTVSWWRAQLVELSCVSIYFSLLHRFITSLMRLWWVWLLILFVFMAFTCNSCQESFKYKQGLSKHQRVCAKVKKTKIDGLEWRQKKQQKTSSVEPENLGEEVEDLGPVRKQFQFKVATIFCLNVVSW